MNNKITILDSLNHISERLLAMSKSINSDDKAIETLKELRNNVYDISWSLQKVHNIDLKKLHIIATLDEIIVALNKSGFQLLALSESEEYDDETSNRMKKVWGSLYDNIATLKFLNME